MSDVLILDEPDLAEVIRMQIERLGFTADVGGLVQDQRYLIIEPFPDKTNVASSFPGPVLIMSSQDQESLAMLGLPPDQYQVFLRKPYGLKEFREAFAALTQKV